jgi:hypothetical protein
VVSANTSTKAVIGGAAVRIEIGPQVLGTTTDAQGLFTLTGIVAGTGTLYVNGSGYGGTVRVVVVDSDIRVDVQLAPSGSSTLSGLVFEVTSAGPVPVEGVDVYCDSCGKLGHTYARTDPKGTYNFASVYGGDTPLLIRKPGFRVVGASRRFADGYELKSTMANGDTRFDIELARE